MDSVVFARLWKAKDVLKDMIVINLLKEFSSINVKKLITSFPSLHYVIKLVQVWNKDPLNVDFFYYSSSTHNKLNRFTRPFISTPRRTITAAAEEETFLMGETIKPRTRTSKGANKSTTAWHPPDEHKYEIIKRTLDVTSKEPRFLLRGQSIIIKSHSILLPHLPNPRIIFGQTRSKEPLRIGHKSQNKH